MASITDRVIRGHDSRRDGDHLFLERSGARKHRGAEGIDIALGLGAVFLLIVANAFFVAAEFALVAVDRGILQQKAEEGNRRARIGYAAIKTLSFQLSGAQLGITITSLLLGFVIEPTIGEALVPFVDKVPFVPEGSTTAAAVTFALALATVVQMVVGELVPQNLGVARPLRLTLAVAGPLQVFNRIFKPLIVGLNASANWTVRILGIEPRDELLAVHSLEEIEILIQSSRHEGSLDEEEARLLARSINFAEKTAADALVPRTSVTFLSQEDSVRDMLDVALSSGHSRFPVVGADADDVVGVAYVKDAYRIPHGSRSTTKVSSLIQLPLVVPESRQLDTLLLEMRRERKQIAIVVDEYGGTEGIITLEDMLEEIVGDIEDEYDPSEPSSTTSPLTGTAVVPGLLHPDELLEATGFELPEGDYDTLAGFLLKLFDRIPERGEHVSFEGWEFKVVEMDRNRISQVLVVRSGSAEGSTP